MRVVVSDTHAPRRWKSCPPAVALRLRNADLILHAGDVCTATVLDELAAYAPVRAVLGNNDGADVAAWGAPPTSEFDLDGLPVAIIHDQPNVSLQVLPLTAGPHPATTGEFTILGFPDLIAPDVVYLENMTSDLYVEREADVYRYAMAFDRLREIALPPRDSATLITARADTIK